jgi:hypothetical protein
MSCGNQFQVMDTFWDRLKVLTAADRQPINKYGSSSCPLQLFYVTLPGKWTDIFTWSKHRMSLPQRTATPLFCRDWLSIFMNPSQLARGSHGTYANRPLAMRCWVLPTQWGTGRPGKWAEVRVSEMGQLMLYGYLIGKLCMAFNIF